MSASIPPSPEFRVTFFVGPQTVEGKPCTQSCVFNVKKRSWKGGIQVAVELTDDQIEAGHAALDFSRWLAAAQRNLSGDERAAQAERARELFVQALCWCKLDVLLRLGIAQDNHTLAADALQAEFARSLPERRDFVTAYVATELDLAPRENIPS